MDIKSYIDSGLLEAYVVGTLPTHQIEEVIDLAAKYPEIRLEIARIEEALETLAMSEQVAPMAPELSDKMLSTLNRKGSSSASNGRKSSNTSSSIHPMMIMAVLAGILAIGGLLYGFWAHQKIKKCENQLSAITTQQLEFAGTYETIQADIAQLESAVAIMGNKDFKKVELLGTDKAPTAYASIFWNKTTSELYLKAGSLASLASDQQYQLWAIVGGNPVDAGVFSLDSDYLHKMKGISGDAKTFAVTIEKTGGNASPTLETMQVAGNL